MTFYGEVLLYCDDKSLGLGFNNHNNKPLSNLAISDWGRLPSNRKIIYDDYHLPYAIKENLIDETSLISNLETNIYSPNNFLSEHDIYYMVKAVKDINGIAMLRILPNKHNDYKHFGSSKIKIIELPLKDIDYEELPLNRMINQTVRELKREKIKSEISSLAESHNLHEIKIDVLLDNDELTHYFDVNQLFTVDDFNKYNIKHLIKSYTWSRYNATNISKDINQMLKELSVNDETGYGFNLLLTTSYLFIAPLVAPYVFDNDNHPLFAEPYFFGGIFTLPLIQAEWPETIKSEFVQFDHGEILKKSTNK